MTFTYLGVSYSPTIVNPAFAETEVYYSRVCMPKGSSDIAIEFRGKLKSYLEADVNLIRYITDLLYCWWIFLIAAVAAFFYGLVYMILLRFLVKIMVWVTIIVTFLLLFIIACVCFYWRTKYDNSSDGNRIFFYTAIVLWVLCAIYLLLILCCCR